MSADSTTPTSPASPTTSSSPFDVVGIDLGATNCRLTHLVPTKHMPVILRNSLGNENTPSMVCYLPGQQRLAGEESLGKEMSKPKSTINALKQAMLQCDNSKGCSVTAASNAIVDSFDDGELPDRLSFEFPSDGSEDFPVDSKFPWKQRAEQILGFQLKQLLRNAPPTSSESGERIISVSVPANSSVAGYRNSLRAAARVAGVSADNFVLVNEPEAAALYLHHLQFKSLPAITEKEPNPQPIRLAIVSIGEVSSFAQIVEVTQSTVKITAQNADSNLGTRDIDNALVSWAVGEIKKKSGGVDVSDHLKSMNKVRRDCSKAKVMLSTTDRTTMSFESLKDGIDVNVTISRSEMEQFAAPALERFRALCTFKGDNDAAPAPITRVEVIGNGWRAPCIQNAIKTAFSLPSDTALGMSLDANTAIAEGAAIAAVVRRVRVAAAAAAATEDGEDKTKKESTTNNNFFASHSVTFENEAESSTGSAVAGSNAHDIEEALITSWIKQEEEMCERDHFFMRRLAAQNDLEKAVLSLMEVVDDIKFESDADNKRDDLRKMLRDTDDWLRDFDTASTEEFIEQKKNLDEKIKAQFPEVETHYEKLREEQRKKDEELTKLAATRAEEKELKSDPQRLRVAGERREQGANLFKQEHWEEAQTRFVQAVAILQEIYDLNNEDTTKERNKILLSCYLNIASCGIKLQRWRNAANNATKALEIDTNHPKAFFRRGQANVQLGEFDAAKQDLEKALQLSGGDAGVKAELDSLSKKIEAQKNREKKMYGKMFG